MLRRMMAAATLLALLGGPLAMAAPQSGDKKGPKPTIAVFRLSGEITEAPNEDMPFSFGGGMPTSFKDLVARMKKAGEDKHVKAIVILHEGAGMGRGQMEELRQVMAEVRKGGKELYAHSDSLSMGQFTLLSGVNRLSVVPTGDLWVTGLFGEGMYLRGLLDMLGVKPDYLTCGAYKSAAEMFMRDSPSPEADAMQNWLIDSIYATSLDLIAKGRGVDVEKVKSWIDNGPYTARSAKESGIVDAVEHRQEFEAMLKQKYGKDVVFDRKYGKKKAPEIDLDNPFAAFKLWADLLGESQKKKKPTKPAVGIVYVDGPILLGGGGEADLFGGGAAMSSPIRKALDQAAGDDTIKAVVLRVDSPGGSAVASEIILDATRRVKAKKPFVVSMGNVAGSGGYYVACAADTIFADESTITGSIGVVAGKFGVNDMFKRVGITFKEYKRGANAGLLSSGEPFTQAERQRLQTWMDEIYGVFKGHVTAIRGNRLKKPIDDLAGGRVYTGKQGLELGLVDRIGTMQDAVKFVAEQAKISDYDVRVVPEPKNFIDQLIEEFSGGGKEDQGRLVKMPTGPSILDIAMPLLKKLDARRAKQVRMALDRMELLQREGCILMMPEIALPR